MGTTETTLETDMMLLLARRSRYKATEIKIMTIRVGQSTEGKMLTCALIK